jgi:cell surface protein SprA
VKIGNKKLVNDLNVRGDFNLRQNNTIIRKLIEGTNQPSAGTTNIGIKFSADYNINDRFNIKAFYDRQANEPFVSSSFPNSNTRIGFSIRFSLAQ